MTQYFTPPTFEVGMSRDRKSLFRYFTFPRGATVYITGSTVTEERYPFQGDLDEADYVYLGGHRTAISPAEAVILTNNGYGAYIS